MISKILYRLIVSLAAVGAANWGLVGLFRLNLVNSLLGRSPIGEKTAYLAVGFAGVWLGAAQLLPRVLLALGVKREDPMQALANRLLVGTTMPPVSGTTLDGRRVAIPADTLGKVTLLAMGFSYDSRFEVEEWLRAFQERFGQDPVAQFYEMAMIDGSFRLFGAAIQEGMRRASPAETHNRVVTVYAPQRQLRQTLRAPTTSDTWVYLLDTEGQVLFQCGGPFDAERFQELTWVVDAALARAKAPVPEIIGTL